jgi:hypothetical protein
MPNYQISANYRVPNRQVNLLCIQRLHADHAHVTHKNEDI